MISQIDSYCHYSDTLAFAAQHKGIQDLKQMNKMGEGGGGRGRKKGGWELGMDERRQRQNGVLDSSYCQSYGGNW